jgi:hypothetical protein
LLKNSWRALQSPSAAKAVAEKPVIAAVNRCATQRQEQNRVFQLTARLKPRPSKQSQDPLEGTAAAAAESASGKASA